MVRYYFNLFIVSRLVVLTLPDGHGVLYHAAYNDTITLAFCECNELITTLASTLLLESQQGQQLSRVVIFQPFRR